MIGYKNFWTCKTAVLPVLHMVKPLWRVEAYFFFDLRLCNWISWNRVSIGRGQCNFLGQKDRSFFIVPGQKDNRTRMGREIGQSLFFCQNPGWDAGCGIWDGTQDGTRGGTQDRTQDGTRDGIGNTFFFPIISCHRTSFPVLECTFSVLECLSCFRTSFSVLEFPFLQGLFPVFFCGGEVILSQVFCFCPCSRTKGQQDKEIFLSRDVQFLGNPNLKPLGFCAGLKVFRVESFSLLHLENCGGISNTWATCLAGTVQHWPACTNYHWMCICNNLWTKFGEKYVHFLSQLLQILDSTSNSSLLLHPISFNAS